MVLKSESVGPDIQNLVTSSVPGSELARHHGKEISFVLPRDKVTDFPPLFNKVGHRISLTVTRQVKGFPPL